MHLWCSHCKAQCPTRKDQALVCCYVCGKVISDDYFSEEPTFVKGAGGESRLAGSYVRSQGYEHSESHERTIDKGKDEIRSIALRLGISDAMIYPASSFYRIAVERKFTRGRRTTQVAAACLYIACRTNDKPKPYLLIDFSEALSVNVYVLGAVFLQLCQLLSLQEHNIVRRPIDPTLFIPRFTEKLLSEMNTEVSRTASRIIASMKRDWMQTGRKPSGICGAALYISALSHGFKFSKSDIGKIVHICEVTLTKRLIEFENTDSGSLTIEELNMNDMEAEKCKFSSFGSQESAELLCQHKDSGSPFAHGLCKDCFEEFIEISGGLGGSDPPAFQHAERMRLVEESAKKPDESAKKPDESAKKPDESDEDFGPEIEKMSTDHDKGKCEKVKSLTKPSQFETNNQRLETMDCPSNMDVISDQVTVDSASDNYNKLKDASTIDNDDYASADNKDESDGLSDIDDVELSGYLNNEEETRRKAAVWEEMNREYLEEQAAKISNGGSAAKPKKERRQKRALDDHPAQTAAEATRQMLSKKRISSKINYDALDKCFAGDLAPDSNKKRDPSSDNGDKTGKDLGAEEHDSDNMKNENERDYEDMNQEYGEKTGHEYGYGCDYDESNLEYGYDYGYDEVDNEY